jgi:hypothetical protein
MKFAALSAALLLASGSVQAHSERHERHTGCDVDSRYSVDTYRRAFLFTDEDGNPTEIGIGGGRLFIDGKEATLTAADHARLRQMETEMQLLVPEMRKVAVEAVDIAFTALTEVARGLSNNPEDTVSRLESSHRRVRSEMTEKPLSVFNDEAMGDIVKPIITKFIPDIVGGAISSALSAAFGGEQKAQEFEKRMERMERELERKVENRAEALEPLADAMCKRLDRIDDLDDSLEYRLPNGDSLQLLRVRHHDQN